MSVYFIGCERSPLIKIGYARDVKKRLSTLQIGSPRKLTLLGIIDGPRQLEIEIHRVLSSHNVTGEWFDGKMAGELLRASAGLNIEQIYSLLLRIEKGEIEKRRAWSEMLQRLETRFVPTIRSTLEKAIADHGIGEVSRVMLYRPGSLERIMRSRNIPEFHRILNLLTLDIHSLDDVFAIYGGRLVAVDSPLIPAMLCVVREANSIKGGQG